MKIVKITGTLGLLALAVMVSPLVSAQDAGWYVGANAGKSAATIDDAGIKSNLAGQGLTTSSISDRDSSTGYKIFGGYQFNPNFALEGGYFDLGKFGYTATTVPAGTLNGDIKIRGLNLDAVGTLPLSDKFSVLGRVGMNYANTTGKFAGTGPVNVVNPSPSKRDLNYKVGLGVQYAFTEALAMRAEVERYRINDAVRNKGDIDVISVGLVYRFGGKTHQAVQTKAAYVPEPVREVVVAAPPTPRFEKYTLAASELFGFDSAELPPQQPKLEEIAKALTDSSENQNVVITGYTDRLGATQYNQELSDRRALAVKNYLASKGVDANRLTAVGKGEADPVVVCGPMKRVDLINCLEPNRRVEIAPISFERRID